MYRLVKISINLSQRGFLTYPDQLTITQICFHPLIVESKYQSVTVPEAHITGLVRTYLVVKIFKRLS